jgi:hypothetical protein
MAALPSSPVIDLLAARGAAALAFILTCGASSARRITASDFSHLTRSLLRSV